MRCEAGTEERGPFLTPRCQRQVCVAGVAPGEAPLGFAVAREVYLKGDLLGPSQSRFRAQAGLPIISGRPERSDRLALSITAPARTRCPGRTQTRPTAA